MSYLLWGSTPDDALLDAAQAGELENTEQLLAAARRLLADPRALRQTQRFHALWLGYDGLSFSGGLGGLLKTESDMLIDKVVFQSHSPWTDLFTATETFANDELAQHYGLTSPTTTTGTWVSYAGTDRQGLLSHGSVLTNGSKPADTSPTLRGLFIRNRLMCQVVPPPPPNVNVDDVAQSTTSPCKIDQYAAHTSGGCSSCHSQMDPIGFGLENYDSSGAYRAHDIDHPECTIAGQGELVGIGSFHGPGQLSNLLVSTGTVQRCVVDQFYRFANGRAEATQEAPVLEYLRQEFEGTQYRFDELMLRYISSPAFAYRREE
jgi:hypothetical protein